MTGTRKILLTAFGAVLALSGTAWAWQGLTYHKTATIALPTDGGWDYLTVDADAKRLYISRGQAAQVQVVDLNTQKLIGTIENTKGVHGIVIATEFNKGFTSNGTDSTVTVFDLKTLKETDRITVTGRNPDALLYDPFSKRVFTFNHSRGNITAIDAATNKVLGTVGADLGTLEAGASDLAGQIFVNSEDKNDITVFDAKTLQVKAHWPLTGCTAPTGMAIDRQHKRLFSACNDSKTVTVVDYTNGKVVATPAICQGTDAAAFDAAQQLVFASCGEGAITAIHEDSPDKYTVLGDIQTEPRARTMSIDEKTHKLYTVTATYTQGPAPAGGGRGRSTMTPGTFHVIVIEK